VDFGLARGFFNFLHRGVAFAHTNIFPGYSCSAKAFLENHRQLIA
jgi:hypothetical protein